MNFKPTINKDGLVPVLYVHRYGNDGCITPHRVRYYSQLQTA